MLGNLARVYGAEGSYPEAESLLKRSLAILENTRGAKAPELVGSLENYAGVLRKMSRNAEATEVEARAEAIRAERPPGGPPTRVIRSQ
jgi:hypothetical protein